MNIYIGGPKTVIVSDMQGPAPDGFHVPSSDEWYAIDNAGISLGAWKGYTPVDFSTYLKIPMAGYREFNNTVYEIGSEGQYWSSSAHASDASYAYFLMFRGSDVNPTAYTNRARGIFVRCVKNSPTIPTASWTVLYQGTGDAGIFHNATDGLISISSDGTTWYTIMDKNLGATTVYNYGDTLSVANTGNTFQWGNNYPFPSTLSSDSITTSSTQVNATGYGPGNYYSSSTYITGYGNWSYVNNKNLRGGVSQGTSTKTEYQEVKNIYIGEYGWVPGANTIAYYPFRSDILDHSGNNKNFTGSGYSFANNTITTTSTLTGPIVTPENTTGDRTISAWIYRTNGNHAYAFRASNYGTEGHLNAYDQENGNRPGASLYINGWKRNRPSSSELPTMGDLILMTWTKTGTTMKLYINGVLTSTNSSLGTATWVTGYGITKSYLDAGTYGEIIVEDKIWTDSEIADYYNKTKSKYGL